MDDHSLYTKLLQFVLSRVTLVLMQRTSADVKARTYIHTNFGKFVLAIHSPLTETNNKRILVVNTGIMSQFSFLPMINVLYRAIVSELEPSVRRNFSTKHYTRDINLF